FLVPQGKAVPATASNLAEFETRRAEYEAKAKSQLEGAEGRKAKLEGATVTVHANAATEGKLYGSVTPRDIAEALTKAGYPVNKSEVIMGEGPIRRTGEYDVLIHLHADVEITVKVT
ncbi:50S ribosomal protein L9, partial [Lysobacter sp. 2RAB21]